MHAKEIWNPVLTPNKTKQKLRQFTNDQNDQTMIKMLIWTSLGQFQEWLVTLALYYVHGWPSGYG